MIGTKIKSFFKNIFNKTTKIHQGFTSLKMLNSWSPKFFNYNHKEYNNVVYRACIDRISSQMAKLTPNVDLNGIKSDILYYSNLEYLLKNKPNEYMNKYDFFYKLTSMLLDKNNVFVYKRVEDNKISGLYPIDYSEIEFMEYEGEIYAKFSFKNSSFNVYIPYDELIHLRRHYNDNDLFGSSQQELLTPIFEVLSAVDSGMINAVNASSQLRGLIKYSGNLNPDDLKRFKDQFVEDYMGLNGSGIGTLDSKADFIPINLTPYTINADQQKTVLEYFSMHFGVSDRILKGLANEEEYNAFYELTIEPMLVQLSAEFTNKIFSKIEIMNGCKITLTANKLLFANNATKTTIATQMTQIGVFSLNEVREIYGYGPIKDGDRHIISLNYVDLKNANKYQIGENKEELNNENKTGNTKSLY